MTCPEFQFTYDHIQKLLDRRQTATAFYFSVNTGILAALGFLLQEGSFNGGWWTGILAVLLIVGYITCCIWRSTVHYFGKLLDWWYERLRELEASKPEDKQLVTQEYKALYSDKKRSSVTKLLLVLNWTFSVLYIVAAVGLIVNWLALLKVLPIAPILP